MASNFPPVLAQVLRDLNMTQMALADAVGVSHSMVTKLLAGEEAHRKTYEKIFAFFRQQPGRSPMAVALLVAHLKDVVTSTGMDGLYRVTDPTGVRSDEEQVSNFFLALSAEIRVAFTAIGYVAMRDRNVREALMSLASLAISVRQGGSAGQLQRDVISMWEAARRQQQMKLTPTQMLIQLQASGS